MTFYKKHSTFIIAVLLAGFAGSLEAQVKSPQNPAQNAPKTIEPSSVTEQEIEKIVEITNSATAIQQQSQKKVKDAVDSSAISYQRFVQIIQASQTPGAIDSLNLTQEEQQELGKLQPRLQQINRESQQEFVELIKEKGMEPQRFQQIMIAAQQHPQLVKRIEEKRKEIEDS